MKLIFALVATLIAFSAHATDRKIGNVIAVEREISDVYNRCVEATSKMDGERSTFFCAIKYTKSPVEMALPGRAPLMYEDGSCVVSSELGNGNILFTFGKKSGSSDFAGAKECLAKAIASKGTIKTLVYTIE
ncbi:MAG: hypothetical protein ACM3MG_01500 [Bacillota bacterium]